MPREAFCYEHTDIPPGITLAEWRGMRASQARDTNAAAGGPRRVIWALFGRRPSPAVVCETTSLPAA
jgi:hypothetical protein